ncbi:MAG: TniQ family protein [Luteibacter sp.]
MLKLRIAPPGAGESLSSVVDRAAGLFNVARSNILRQLGCAGDPDLDIGSESVLGGLSRAMSLSIEDLADICLTHGREQQFVRRVERFAYCPLCMADDVQSGSVPWFRLDWSRLWMTHCACHGTPLPASVA